ncbi:MAG: response regulator transcription factor [Chthoniobacterales bacterium]
MNILIAEDDAISRLLLTDTLTRWGHQVEAVENGEQAWEVFQRKDAPPLAILDWMMPGLDGLEVCRRARSLPRSVAFHIILLTAREQKADIVGGLEVGANDYMVKPFDPAELRARVGVGERMIVLQEELAARVIELEAALEKVKKLQGMLPICSYCKKIRNDEDYWQEVETYLGDHSEAEFSHGICPHCFEKLMGVSFAEAKAKKGI